MRPAAVSASLVFFMVLSCLAVPSHGQNVTALMDTDSLHHTPEWANIQAHLPDPAVAPVASLEEAADILRARRYGGDALRYYSAALARGGNRQILMKKMGITCLEMEQVELARLFFQRAVRLNKRDPVAWNDLGAAEFTLHNTRGAINDYKKAVKLEQSSAVFHSNLALAYFEANDAEDARTQLAKAMRLDPDLLHRRDGSGYNAQILATTRYAEICFEMARIYASQGNVPAMLDWLTKASERGYDVRAAMDRDSILRPLLADARVQVILKNARLLRAGNKVPVKVPSLGTTPQ